MSSLKTTILGICVILVAIGSAGKALLDGDPGTAVDVEAVMASVMAGLAGMGLIAARDNDKASEDVGLK